MSTVQFDSLYQIFMPRPPPHVTSDAGALSKLSVYKLVKYNTSRGMAVRDVIYQVAVNDDEHMFRWILLC
jgi:hypothetical protein